MMANTFQRQQQNLLGQGQQRRRLFHSEAAAVTIAYYTGAGSLYTLPASFDPTMLLGGSAMLMTTGTLMLHQQQQEEQEQLENSANGTGEQYDIDRMMMVIGDDQAEHHGVLHTGKWISSTPLLRQQPNSKSADLKSGSATILTGAQAKSLCVVSATITEEQEAQLIDLEKTATPTIRNEISSNLETPNRAELSVTDSSSGTLEESAAADDTTSTAGSASATTSIQAHGVTLPTQKVLENGETAALDGHFLRKFTFYGVEMDIYVASLYRTTSKGSSDADEPSSEEKEKAAKAIREEREMAMARLDTAPADDSEDITDEDEEDDESPEEIAPQTQLEEEPSICVDVLLLYDYPAQRIRSAWKYEMDNSVTDCDYDGYQADKRNFLNLIAKKVEASNNTDDGQNDPNMILQSVQLFNDGTTVIVEQGQAKGTIVGKDFQKAFLSLWFGDKPVGKMEEAQIKAEPQQKQAQPATPTQPQETVATLSNQEETCAKTTLKCPDDEQSQAPIQVDSETTGTGLLVSG